MFKLNEGKWDKVGAMKNPRIHHFALEMGEKIVTCGGRWNFAEKMNFNCEESGDGSDWDEFTVSKKSSASYQSHFYTVYPAATVYRYGPARFES